MSFQPNALAGSPPAIPAGTVVDYAEFNTDVTISATTDVGANTVVTGVGFNADGASYYLIEFVVAAANPGATAGAALFIVLYDNGTITSNPRIGQMNSPAAVVLVEPVNCAHRIVPTAGFHQYSVRGYRLTTNGAFLGSNSGTGKPGFLRITKDS